MSDLAKAERLRAEFYERVADARFCPACAVDLVEWIKCGEGYDLEAEDLWNAGDGPEWDHLFKDFMSVELAGCEFGSSPLHLSSRIDELVPKTEDAA